MNSAPTLLGIGAAHIDRRGQVAGDYIQCVSNPGSMREEAGGVAFNVMRNAVRHGVAGSLLSVRGGDAAGSLVAQAIAAAGIRDLSVTFLDRASPSYTALLDSKGDLIAGLADMELYEIALAKQMTRRPFRDAAAAADAVFFDANLSVQAIERLTAAAAGRPLYAVAISPAKAVRLATVLPSIACLFMNRHEAATLGGDDRECVVNGLRRRGLAAGVITDGAGAVTIFDRDAVLEVVPPRPAAVVDVTGAGDALAGVTIARLMCGDGLDEAIRHGLAAALLTIEAEAAVAAYSDERFAVALALVDASHPRNVT